MNAKLLFYLRSRKRNASVKNCIFLSYRHCQTSGENKRVVVISRVLSSLSYLQEERRIIGYGEGHLAAIYTYSLYGEHARHNSSYYPRCLISSSFLQTLSTFFKSPRHPLRDAWNYFLSFSELFGGEGFSEKIPTLRIFLIFHPVK